MKPIYLLCLHGVRTGGPEAIHQLSDALIEQGFDARMVYYTWNQIAALEAAKPQSAYFFGERPVPYAEYERYRVNIVDSVPNSPDCVVVLPETLCHLAPKFDKATVLIWWLSVDNGFGALSRVNLNHLRAANVRHVFQSRYAEQFCAALQFDPIGALSDYTIDLREHATPIEWAERPMLVAYNANHKVIADLDRIIASRPELQFKPVSGSRSQVAQLLASARAYLDLGSFPGKDRLPREAVLMGSVPVLGWTGAANTDLPGAFQPDRFYGDIERSASKLLANMYRWDFDGVMAKERLAIEGEYRVFMREVSAIFGLLGAEPDA